ncbi:MAG: ferritin-like domain-containing protein, partial [Pseudomonadota bacterium]|nr:ferritin-like domain-containing protein [Pseudomonadota bacterium]
IEDWSWKVFHVLLYNLSSPEQKKPTYEALGLDWKMVQERFIDAFTHDEIRRRMSDNDNIFRVLVKTLFNAGIITDRTASKYAPFVDLSELEAEGTSMVGDEIAEEGIKYLMAINGDDGPVFNFSQTAAE